MRERKLPSNAVLILASLAEGDRHGYAIRKDVAHRTGDEVTLGVTTLYRLLSQLLDEGLVEESPQHRVDIRTAKTDDRPADALLIRPDAHIAWAAATDEPADTAAPSLREALSSWFGTP